jgi:alginate O-acetyltransferase complex protein AlgI
MEFITFPCICLVLVTFVLYYARKDIQWQKIILLISSTFFIAYYHILFIIAAIGISLFTFYAGKCIVKYKDSPKASWLLTLFIGVLASVWLAFRYWSPIFPLGISFYTFQALSYLIEVYWDDGEAEANVLDFVLYMLLFMKFLSGPIERGYDLLPQLKQVHKFNYKGITEGVRFTAIGIFMKIVIADRLAPHLDNIFSAVHNASGIQLLESTLLYPLQLYSDFAGYTCMAIGLGMIFGFKLSPNFNRPFISQTTGELWRRWHMSLSFWVRDYVFIPLTASTRSWKSWGIYFSLIVTFVVLGIWHGAGWTFVIYGLIQGLIIIYETAAGKKREYVKGKMNKRLFFVLSIIRTYILFALSLLFFRVTKIDDVFYIISHLFSGFNSKTLIEAGLGMSGSDWNVLCIATILLFIFEYANSKRNLFELLDKCHVVTRWCIYYIFLLLLFLYGCFGVDNFIYIQF